MKRHYDTINGIVFSRLFEEIPSPNDELARKRMSLKRSFVYSSEK